MFLTVDMSGEDPRVDRVGIFVAIVDYRISLLSDYQPKCQGFSIYSQNAKLETFDIIIEQNAEIHEICSTLILTLQPLPFFFDKVKI